MPVLSGNQVTVVASGTPVCAGSETDGYAPPKPIPCHAVQFQAVPGNTGIVYIGAADMDIGHGRGIFARIGVSSGDPTAIIPSFSAAITIAPNALNLNDFFVDADNNGDAVNVAFIQL